MFVPLPGCTDLIEYHTETVPDMAVHSCHYHLYEHKNVVWQEFKSMFDMGVIEDSQNDWRRLMLLVPKAIGAADFCVDFSIV